MQSQKYNNDVNSSNIIKNKEIQDLVFNILIKNGRMRTNEELRIIEDAMPNFSYLYNLIVQMPPKTTEQLLKELTLEIFPKGSTVFCYGDTPKSFYTILKGSVYVLLKKLKQSRIDFSKEKNKQNSGNLFIQENYEKDNIGDNHSSNQSTDFDNIKKNLGNSTKSIKSPRPSIMIQSRFNPGLTINILEQSTSSRPDSGVRTPINPDFLLDRRKSIIIGSWPSKPITDASTGMEDSKKKPSHFSKIENHIVFEESLSEEYVNDMFPGFSIVNTLKVGDHFGEIALVNCVLRTGTIVCKEETYLIALNGSAYRRILGRYHSQMMAQKLEFFKSIPYFSQWPIQQIEGLLRGAELIKLRRNTVLFDENNICDKIYIIYNGEVEITKLVGLDQGDEHDICCKNPMNELDEVKIKMSKINHIWQQKLIKNQSKRIKIALLGKGQVLGCEEILQINGGSSLMAKATVVTENAEIYIIEKEKFVKNTNNIKFLENTSQIERLKHAWRANLGKDAFHFKTEIEKNILISTQGSIKRQSNSLEFDKIKAQFLKLQLNAQKGGLTERAIEISIKKRSNDIQDIWTEKDDGNITLNMDKTNHKRINSLMSTQDLKIETNLPYSQIFSPRYSQLGKKKSVPRNRLIPCYHGSQQYQQSFFETTTGIPSKESSILGKDLLRNPREMLMSPKDMLMSNMESIDLKKGNHNVKRYMDVPTNNESNNNNNQAEYMEYELCHEKEMNKIFHTKHNNERIYTHDDINKKINLLSLAKVIKKPYIINLHNNNKNGNNNNNNESNYIPVKVSTYTPVSLTSIEFPNINIKRKSEDNLVNNNNNSNNINNNNNNNKEISAYKIKPMVNNNNIFLPSTLLKNYNF